MPNRLTTIYAQSARIGVRDVRVVELFDHAFRCADTLAHTDAPRRALLELLDSLVLLTETCAALSVPVPRGAYIATDFLRWILPISAGLDAESTRSVAAVVREDLLSDVG